MRQGLRADLDKFGVVRQIFRQGYLRHRSLMMEALLNPLKRSHQIEKRLVVLARDDAPVGKAAAVHIGLDTKIDRMILISSEEHTSELQSLMRISYAVFCLKKTKNINKQTANT